MKKQPYVNPDKIVVMGHSQGGWAAIAFSTLKVDGVLGTVNLSGGTNYTGINNVLPSITYSKWISDCGEYGKINVIPTLWIYSPNDLSIPGHVSQSMFNSFLENGGKGTLVMKPAFSTNGHGLYYKPELFINDLLEFFIAIGMTNSIELPDIRNP